MAEEKIVVLNLRKLISGKPRWKRKGYSARLVRKIVANRTKSDRVTMTKELNEELWKSSGKIKIRIAKGDKSTNASLVK